MGGVNHYSLHCRLAKCRDSTNHTKYGAVIGYNKKVAFLCVPRFNFIVMVFFPANHSAVCCTNHQITEFRRTTVLTTVVAPPIHSWREFAPPGGSGG